MTGILTKAFGYQGDAMNLPVADAAAAAAFYEEMFGFRVTSRVETPVRSIGLARDAIEMRLVENGGDPTQDGCAFHVVNLSELHEELRKNGLTKGLGDISVEQRDGVPWRVFFVVAPDGLCFWFGERQA